MTQVYDFVNKVVVATGNSYQKVGLHYEVPNCIVEPGQNLTVNERYQLREEGKATLSVKCLGLPAPGIQTATFAEV